MAAMPRAMTTAAVTQRIQRPEPDRLALAATATARPRLGRVARAGARVAAPGPGVVGPHLGDRHRGRGEWPDDRAVLLRVRGVGHPGRGGRAGDVGDRRDVVPVDAVADAEERDR